MNPAAIGGGFNPNIPNAARMYDYFLGGKDNLPVDREAARQVLRYVPEVPIGIRENRAFLQRVVRYLAGQGIRQFLDIGAGLPTQRNVHQVAGEYAPGARTVYVDNAPQVLAHARALLQDSPLVLVTEGDLREPGRIIDDPDIRTHLDFGQPIAVLLLAIVHFIPDSDDPAGIIERIRRSLAPGSHIALSHVVVEDRPTAASGVERVYQSASAPFVPRMSSQVTPFFDGLEVAEPGIVNLHEWRPESDFVTPSLQEIGAYFLCGVGRVP